MQSMTSKIDKLVILSLQQQKYVMKAEKCKMFHVMLKTWHENASRICEYLKRIKCQILQFIPSTTEICNESLKNQN